MTPRSLNEIDQTTRKAARGCGLPWGVADEVGKAIRWLHVFGLDGTRGLISVLEQYDHQQIASYSPESLDGTWQSPAGILSPLLTGLSLCDCMERLKQQSITTGRIAWPLLTAGFLGQKALNAELSVKLSWQSVTLELHRDQLAVTGNHADLEISVCESLSCSRSPISSDAAVVDAVIGEVSVDDAIWQKMEHYAHRTYVEATEASRLAGAGAGLNDND